MSTSTRDKLLMAMVGGFVAMVLAGYGWTLATGRSFSRIEFGLSPLTAQGAPAFLEGRVDPKSGVGRWVSGEWTARVRNYLRDEFVGFDRILTGYASAVTSVNALFYQALLPDAPMYPVGVDAAGAFYYPSEQALVRVTPGVEGAAAKVDTYVDAARRLTSAHPDVTFVFYGVSPWRMTPAALEAGYNDPAVGAWDEFSDRLSDGAAAGRLRVEDWSNFFFRTDHHWTPRGAYQGYRDIVELFEQRDPSLSIETLPFSDREVDGVRFRGAISRKAAYLDLSEPFRVITTRAPGVHAFLDGKPADDLIVSEDYLADPPDGPFESHYSLANGSDFPMVEYRSARADGGNLLIVADSYSNSMEDLLAAGFARTYVVDLRYIRKPGEPFDIDGFIAENDITHVLFLSRPLTVMQMPLAIETGQPLQ